jgi:broad specificity phosphatase PhoE
MGQGGADMTTEVMLVRHGESEWNQSHRYTGQQDVPLSDLGKEQAFRLAERLKDDGLTAIYASPLRRARDTARAIGALAHVPITLEPGLAEINHGAWEGLTAVQVSEKFPAEYHQWRVQPHAVVMPAGESLDDVGKRAAAVWYSALLEQRGGKIVICSHDAVLRVLLLTALGLTLDHFWKWSFENASLSVLHVRGDTGAEIGHLVRLNDTAHLSGVYSEYALQAL